MTDILELNVSGTVVTVRRSTLENCGLPSMVALCNTNFELHSIDRPLWPFCFVLDWIKTMTQTPLPASWEKLSKIAAEAEYWQVNCLLTCVKRQKQSILELSGVSPVFSIHGVSDREQASDYVRERSGLLELQTVQLSDGDFFFVGTVKL